MFTRMSTWKANDAAVVRPSVEAKREDIMAISGIVSCHVVWNADGSGVTFAVYESEAAANASAAQIQAIWGDLASLLSAPPETLSFSDVIDMN